MDLRQALNAYDHHVYSVLKLGPDTWRHRVREATALVVYLEDIDLLYTTEIAAAHCQQFAERVFGTREERRDRAGNRIDPLADSTFNEYISNTRHFLKYLRQEGLLGEDQAPERSLLSRRRPKAKRAKQFLFREDLEEKADEAKEWHQRDKYLVIFGHYMARRAGELRTIQIADIDFDPRPGYPFGLFEFENNKRGGDKKPMPFQAGMVPHLKDWLALYAELLGRPLRKTDYLIPSLVVKGRSVKGARRPMGLNPDLPISYWAMKEALKRIGVRGTHAMRRGGLVAVRQNHNIRAAKTLADHVDERTTEIYMDIHKEREALGDLFASEVEQPAAVVPQPRVPEPEVAEEVTAMDELARRRAQRQRAV